RLVNSDIALNHDFAAILQQRAVHLYFSAEKNATQLRVRIFEREVAVAGALGAKVRDFARYPNLTDLLLEQMPDVPGEFGDRQNFPCRLRWLWGRRRRGWF